MAVLHCIGITIDDDNDTAPENVPEQQRQQQWNGEEGGEVWKPEGIICPRKANNLQNYFACFRNYTKDEVLKMSKLDLFLVLFRVGYLNTILIPETNKVLNDPLDLGELMRWVGCWLYIYCWVGIPERRDWWSVTPQVMHRGSYFRLNEYMSRHCFDEILASLGYTNREVQYEDGFFHMR